MARARSVRRPIRRLQRDYEFSRLNDEWMAAVYALVVRPRRVSHRLQPQSSAACGRGCLPQACQPQGGKAG